MGGVSELGGSEDAVGMTVVRGVGAELGVELGIGEGNAGRLTCRSEGPDNITSG
jgi:hypothetical protein